MFGSFFNERCLKPGLTYSPKAYLPAELAVAPARGRGIFYLKRTTIAPG